MTDEIIESNSNNNEDDDNNNNNNGNKNNNTFVTSFPFCFLNAWWTVVLSSEAKVCSYIYNL